MQIDPQAEKYYGMSPYNGMGNNPILFSDPMGDTIRLPTNNDQLRTEILNDLALIETSSDAGANLVNFLRTTPEDVTLGESETATLFESILGGGKDAASVKKSSAVQDGNGAVTVKYSRINGAEVDGVISQSDETLFHELVHARDFIEGTVVNNPDVEPGNERGRLESRAVQQTNEHRQAKHPNATIRRTYGGKPVVTPNNKIVRDVYIIPGG